MAQLQPSAEWGHRPMLKLCRGEHQRQIVFPDMELCQIQALPPPFKKEPAFPCLRSLLWAIRVLTLK